MGASQKLKIIVVLCFLLLMAACSPKTPAPIATPTLTPYLTRTPTITVQPTMIPTLTPVPTDTPAVTTSPTPGPITGADFSGAKLVRQGFAPGYNYFLVFDLAEHVSRPVHGVIDQNKKYVCETDQKVPTRIRCTGWLPGVDRWKTITIFDTETGAQLFEQRFFIPMYY